MTAPGNTSAAVRQQRHEAHDSLDDFPTPPWATRALCEWIRFQGLLPPMASAEDPAANRGHLHKVLAEYFAEARGADVFDYGTGFPLRDYLLGPPPPDVTWMVTNPPFKLAEAFIHRGLSHARHVAVFVRSAFCEGEGRHARLFAANPPSFELQFSERVVLWKGLCLDPDVPVTRWNEKRREFVTEKPTSATAYSWMIWGAGKPGRTLKEWIAPGTRARLTRPGDYPPLPPELLPRPIEQEGALL